MSETRSYKSQFAVYGFLLGLMFPLLGTLIECSIRFGFFGISHFWECQLDNHLLWIIDSAPLILGLLAAFAGIQMDKVREKNLELNEKFIQMNVLRQMADSANKAKGEFLSNMSHEIRTPLSAIIGFNNLLRGTRLEPEQKHYVETIGIATDNLFLIINDILDSSRLEAGMLVLDNKTFSLHHLIQNLVRLCNERAVSKGLKLVLNYDNSIPPHLIGDPGRLSQILINLVGNAIKFTETGQIDITVQETAKSESGSNIRFIVKDTGIGIRQENIDRIFDRFAQENPSTVGIYGGTGLGLHIVRSLLNLFHGEIQVKSEPGKGSEFSFEIMFPFGVSEPEAIRLQNSEHPDKSELKNLRILLVEDNEFNQFLAETYLKRNGAEVVKAENGKSALQFLETNTFDVILMDIQMPVMDGKEATRILRQQGNKTVVIGCSAHALPAEKAECLALGMNGYITKPFEEKELISVLSYWKPTQKINNMENQGDNVSEILQNVRADVGPDFVKIIIQKFQSDMPVLITELNQHIGDSDFKSIQEKTHRLAGTMATFRFQEGLRLARVAEYHARDGKKDEMTSAVHALNTYLSQTLSQLEKISVA